MRDPGLGTAPQAGTAPAAATAAPQHGPEQRERWLGLAPALRETIGIWVGSRLGVLLVALVGTRVLRGRVPGLSDVPTLWNHWDVTLYVKVARFGYLTPAYQDRTEVDLPGLPGVLRVVHLAVPSWIWTGLLVSFVAGAVTSAALWRLAADDAPNDGRQAAGRRAVLAMVLFPYAVFLFAGYSEGLFLAFATTGWLAARRGRWVLAGALVAGATATRVVGLALLLALWVQYATARLGARGPAAGEPRIRSWRRRAVELIGLAFPLAPVVGFLAYLHSRTGHWDAYSRAMREHWHRSLALPWHGLALTWRAAVRIDQPLTAQVFWWAEIVAVLLGVALTVVLLRDARRAEAVFVGSSTLLMACTTYWASGMRVVLVWFPLYLWIARRQRLSTGYGWVCAPLMAVFVLVFTSGRWVD